MNDTLDAYEIEMLQEQRIVGECIKSMVLLNEAGPHVDALLERWDTFEAFRAQPPA